MPSLVKRRRERGRPDRIGVSKHLVHIITYCFPMSSVTTIIKGFFVFHSYRPLNTHYLSILTLMGNFVWLQRMKRPRCDQLTLRHLCQQVKISVTWGVDYFLRECFTVQWGLVPCTCKPFCDRAILRSFLFLADHCISISDQDVRLDDNYTAPKIISFR